MENTSNRKKRTSQKAKNKRKSKIMPYMQKKLLFLFMAIILALIVLIGIMCFIVTNKGDEFSEKAVNQLNYNSTTLTAKKGSIYDRNMMTLAESYRVYVLILDPKLMTANEYILDTTANAISQCFGLDKNQILQEVQENPSSQYLRFGGKTIVTHEQVDAFEELKTQINKDASSASGTDKKKKVQGVWFETEYRRSYPFNQLASKVIGFTTEDTKEGLWGIEKQYNSILSGIDGRELGFLNDESLLERQIIEPTDGNSVVSTIDLNVQKIISEQINKWVEEYGAKAVSVLAMDPNNGDILALATESDYDLNNPRDLTAFYTTEELNAMSEEDKLKALNETVWRNYVVNNTFEPGSTAKILTVAAALEEGVVTPEDTFYCNGVKNVGGYNIKCHNYAIGGCGHITLAEAVANSCNVAFMEIGERLGRSEFARYQEIFNLGQRTGVDLPGEASAAGLLYTEEQLNVTELATNAFGQGYNVTMMQLASAFASTINGGYYYQPRLVKSIVDSSGRIVEEKEPVLVRETVSPSTSEFIRDALRLTVQEGTGGGTKIEGYDIGGKTGTAEKLPRGNGKYVVSIITAAPIDDPKCILYVAIDEPNVENQADSYPAQQLAGWIWRELTGYLGIHSTIEEEPSTEVETVGEEVETTEEVTLSTDDAFLPGDSIIESEAGAQPLETLAGSNGDSSDEELFINPDASTEEIESVGESVTDMSEELSKPVDSNNQ